MYGQAHPWKSTCTEASFGCPFRGGESLLQEGRLQARLDPNYVVPVTDVVMVDGTSALVMPLVEGCTLEMFQHYEPQPGEVAAILDAIARGIASAHENGITHRDLKPSNVLLDVKHGRIRIRVADFGLARGDRETGDMRSDLFMGTPEYAAPEQFSDPSSVDGKADLWAIGTILYHMTVGEMAFKGTTHRPFIARCVPRSQDSSDAGTLERTGC